MNSVQDRLLFNFKVAPLYSLRMPPALSTTSWTTTPYILNKAFHTFQIPPVPDFLKQCGPLPRPYKVLSTLTDLATDSTFDKYGTIVQF